MSDHPYVSMDPARQLGHKAIVGLMGAGGMAAYGTYKTGMSFYHDAKSAVGEMSHGVKRGLDKLHGLKSQIGWKSADQAKVSLGIVKPDDVTFNTGSSPMDLRENTVDGNFAMYKSWICKEKFNFC